MKDDILERTLGSSELIIKNERIDDYVLLLNVMLRIDLPGIINRHIKHHGLHQGLSFGWLATIWLSHILSQGDHRKVTVRDWVRQSQTTLEKVTGLTIRDTDFTDDRLTLLLEKLSESETWEGIEAELSKVTIRVYDLEQTKVRIDTTTASGYHAGGEDSLMQYGHSKDDPNLKQIKVLIGSLDPLGMPLITEVVSGENADDGLYTPAVERIIKNSDHKKGLLFVGDCKMVTVHSPICIKLSSDSDQKIIEFKISINSIRY